MGLNYLSALAKRCWLNMENPLMSDCRPWHVLPKLKTATLPQRTICFAIAPRIIQVKARLHEHTFRIGYASTQWWNAGRLVDRMECALRRPLDLFDWIRSTGCHDRATWVFAYNLGYSLSLVGLWDRLGLPGMEYVFGVLEDPPTILLTRSGRRLTRWVDILNYWRVPLRELRGCVPDSDLVTLPAASSDADHGYIARRRLRVVENLVCAMVAMLEKTAICGLQSTAASTAWSAYRTSYMKGPIYIHGSREALALERSALAGGRPQAYRIGLVQEETIAYDANSLYPYVMSAEPQPYKLVSITYENSVKELYQALQGYHVVAEISLLGEPLGCDPCVALLLRAPGREDVYCLGGRELSRVVSCYGVVKVGWMARYEQSDLFSVWVRDLYPRKVRAKEKNDFAECLFWKMLLNGLCGKFAQKSRGWKDDRSIPCPDYWGYFWTGDLETTGRTRCRAIAGVAQRLSPGGEVRDSFPAITAGVCGAARSELYELVAKAGRNCVWYTDTDCLHVSRDGERRLQYSGLLHPTRLGALKELARGQDAYYWGPKQYRVGDYWVSNVIQADAEEVTRGVYLQTAHQGLENILSCPLRDRVYVADREVRVAAGLGAYRPEREQA